MNAVRRVLAQGTSDDRKATAEAGQCVVANMHKGMDEALLAWAKAEGRFIRIDRKTDWGNPYVIPKHGDRAEVTAKFKSYLLSRDDLLGKIPSLRGKVLGCWCHPEECHGHTIAEIVNREAAGEGTVS